MTTGKTTMNFNTTTATPVAATPVKDKWKEAEEYLQYLETTYEALGEGGRLTKERLIDPARERFDSGERTEDLYKAIMHMM